MRIVRRFAVIPRLPEPLQPIRDIANNLWWTWDYEAVALLQRMDRDRWDRCNHNPIHVLGEIDQSRLDTLASESVGTSGRAPNQVIDAPLEEIFTVDQIQPDLDAGTRPEVIHAMAEHVTKLGLVEDQGWLEAALAARERLVPTAVPEGVAFLHARRRAADKFPKQFIAMGRSEDGVVFGSPDMGKTHIFFLLALRNDALHLRWLSRLAWIVRSPARLARLMDASSAREIHAAMSEAAGELPGALKPTGAPAGR